MAGSNQVFSQLQRLYSGLSTGRKVSFVIFLVLGVAVVAGLVTFAKQPEFRVLYSDLAAEDVSAIVDELKSKKILYRIGDGGDSIAVPAQDYYEIKMSLATAGLPRGSSLGFEIFDRKSTGMTEFQQQIAFMRAMQGELERSISQISAVEKCRVHLALPKETLFKEDRRDATASVVLELKNNAKLAEDEIEGITFLVAGSVDGLEPEFVTIMDSRGRILSKRKSDDMAGPVNSAMIDYQRKLETTLEQRIVELLGRVVGGDKVAAKVSAFLDFRQITKVEEKYDPDTQVARSEQMVEEKSQGKEQSSSGAPGVDANLPEGAGAAGGQSNTNQNDRKQETINYEISKITSQISEPVGEIKRLSVAVMVDGTYGASEDGEAVEGAEKTYQPRTEAEMEKLTGLVKTAIGFTETRGDQLVVENIQFSPIFESAPPPAAGMDRDLIGMIVNYVLYGVLFLLVAYMGVRMLRFLTTEPTYERMGEMTGLLPVGVDEFEARLAAGPTGPRMLGAAESDVSEAPVNEEEQRRRKMEESRRNMLENVSKDPKAVALMVRRWLKEEH